MTRFIAVKWLDFSAMAPTTRYGEQGLALIKHEFKLLRNSFFRRLFIDRSIEKDIVREFQSLYYDSFVWGNTFWLGRPVLKCPMDLWVYQELITRIAPDWIVETGTAHGGSAHFMASICDHLHHGQVITIDIVEYGDLPQHGRITYLSGSSTSEEIRSYVQTALAGDQTVMVILDSDHSKGHVLNEMRFYGPLVSSGSYLIVEDTNRNGNPVFPDSGPGPMEAVEEYLKETEDFSIDRDLEKHLMTFNPKGYLHKHG